MKKALKLLGLIVGTMALIAGLAYYGLRTLADHPFKSAARSLPNLRKEAVAAGLPMTAQAHLSEKPIPAEQNAAPELSPILDRLREEKWASAGQFEKWASMLEHGSPEDKALVYAEVQKAQPLVDELCKASQKPFVRFERDWDLGAHLLFPEYAQIKGIVKLLLYHAYALAKQAKVDAALRELEAAYRISNQLAGEPVLIAMLSRVACLQLCDAWAGILLEPLSKHDGAMDRVAKITKDGDVPIDVAWSLKAEFMAGMTFLKEGRSSTQGWNKAFHDMDVGTPERSVPHLASNDVVGDGFEARFIEGFLSAKRVYDLSKDYSDFCMELDNQTRLAGDSKDPSYIFLALSTPVFSNVEYALKRREAYRVLFAAMLDVAKFQKRTGRLPKSLLEAENYTQDIFGTGPLLYRIEDGRAVIYSVGKNGRDDGGSLTVSTDDTRVTFPPLIRKR